MSKVASADELSDLIGLVYEAALDPSRWNAFLEGFARAVGGRGTALFMHDFASSESVVDGSGPGLGAVVNFDPAYMQSLVEHYDRKNVWAQNEATLQEGVAVTSDMLYPDRKLLATEWGSDWLRPQDLKFALGGIILRRGSLAVKLSSLRAPSQGAFGEEELRLCRRLIPHLRRASAMHLRMHQLTGLRDAAIEQMDALPFGVLFLAAGGAELHMNAFARYLVARRNGFSLDAQGRCQLGLRSEDARLKRLIHLAADTSTGRGANAGGSMRATRSGAAPLLISVAPVRSAHARGVYELGITPAVLLLVSDPVSAPRTTADTVAALYGLTPAEAELTVALIRGDQLDEHAQRRGVARATVVSQVKSVMHKMGARRQADIVRIVLSGPAVLTPPEWPV